MAMIYTGQDFLFHYNRTENLEISGSVVIDGSIEITGHSNIHGVNKNDTITFLKGITCEGTDIVFENLKVIIKKGDYCALSTVAGCEVKFSNCTIECDDAFVGVLAQQQFALSVLFENCTITSTGPLLKSFDPDEISKLTEFSYQFYQRNNFQLDDVTINTDADYIICLEHQVYPFTISINNAAINAANADNLVYVTGTGHDIHLSDLILPSQMVGCAPTSTTMTQPVFINGIENYNTPGNVQSIISFVSIGLAEGVTMKNYIGTNSISTDARPGGYTVTMDGAPIPTKYIAYKIPLISSNITQDVLDIVRLVDESPVALEIVEAEPTKHLAVYGAKNLTISGVLNAKSLHLIQSYVNIAGTVTLTEAFTCDVLSYVEGSGTLTANSKAVTLPIKNVRTDSRQPKGPILAATGSAGDGPITNAMIAALIEKFGNRIFMIRFDNGMAIDIGYERSAAQSINDVILENIGGVDMIGVRCRMANPNQIRHTRQTTGATYISWHPAACVQAFGIMDEGFERFRPDPMFVI